MLVIEANRRNELPETSSWFLQQRKSTLHFVISMQFKSYVFICKLKASIALRNISFELIDRNEALRVIETQVTIFNGKLTKQLSNVLWLLLRLSKRRNEVESQDVLSNERVS